MGKMLFLIICCLSLNIFCDSKDLLQERSFLVFVFKDVNEQIIYYKNSRHKHMLWTDFVHGWKEISINSFQKIVTENGEYDCYKFVQKDPPVLSES